eukprot:gene48473-50370_t
MLAFLAARFGPAALSAKRPAASGDAPKTVHDAAAPKGAKGPKGKR